MRQYADTTVRPTIDGMVRRVKDDNYRLPRPKPGTIAARIQMAMTKKGMTTSQELAERTKINRQTIHRWFKESADRIDPVHLFIVADALEVAPRWLALEKVGSMQQPRQLTDDEAAILELAANLESLQDGSKDKWLQDGNGRLETARVRASRTLPYPGPVGK